MNDYLQDIKKRIFNKVLGIADIDYLEKIYKLASELDAKETERNKARWLNKG